MEGVHSIDTGMLVMPFYRAYDVKAGRKANSSKENKKRKKRLRNTED